QAEDGIRDFHVTGVQTCALPISLAPREIYEEWRAEAEKDEAVAWALLIWFGERVSTYESQDDDQQDTSDRRTLPPRPRPRRPAQIGRASCRERVWISVAAGS